MKQKIRSFFIVFLLNCIVLMMPAMAFAQEEKSSDPLKLNAQSAVLVDGHTGRILYGKNENTVRPMASTTKIMTCILALENADLDGAVTASGSAASQPEVHLGVRKGETYRLRDLLYSLMLESHNDSAVMIAEAVGGSVEGFADMMNQKARDLGLSGTYFITPNGLDAVKEINGENKEHSTTATDLARIMNYCVEISPKRREFLEITGTSNYAFSDLDKKRSYSCVNHNAFLTMMQGMLSGKTGFTGGAGYCYVGALKDEDRVFTIALLGCGWPPHKTYKWSDARKLFRYGKENFHYRDIFKEQELRQVLIEDGIPESGDLREPVYVSCTLGLEEKEKHLSLMMAETEEAKIEVELPRAMKAPVRKGQEAGMVTYRLNGEIIKTYPIFLTAGVEKVDRSWCMKRLVEEFLSMPGLP